MFNVVNWSSENISLLCGVIIGAFQLWNGVWLDISDLTVKALFLPATETSTDIRPVIQGRVMMMCAGVCIANLPVLEGSAPYFRNVAACFGVIAAKEASLIFGTFGALEVVVGML